MFGEPPAPMPCRQCGIWIQQPQFQYSWQCAADGGYLLLRDPPICRVCSQLAEIQAAYAMAVAARDQAARDRLGDLLEVVVQQLRTEVLPPTSPESPR